MMKLIKSFLFRKLTEKYFAEPDFTKVIRVYTRDNREFVSYRDVEMPLESVQAEAQFLCNSFLFKATIGSLITDAFTKIYKTQVEDIEGLVAKSQLRTLDLVEKNINRFA